MPVMHGYECAQRLREIERTEGRKRLNIIAFSSNDDPTIIQRALEAGCDRYVVKPIPRHVLWQLLTGQSPQVVHAPPSTAVTARSTDPVLVDADLRRAIPDFLASRRKLLDDMPAALAAGDRALFKRLAHRVAGSCALYGFTWAAAQADALENDAATGDLQQLLARAKTLRAYFDSVKIDYAAANTAAK
jgi:CheY-like chemotaxis protein